MSTFNLCTRKLIVLINPLSAIAYRVLLVRLLEKSTTALQALYCSKFENIKEYLATSLFDLYDIYVLWDNQDVSKFYLHTHSPFRISKTGPYIWDYNNNNALVLL